MNKIGRLRQYITKASFGSEVDKLAAIDLIDEIESDTITLIENVEIAAEEWSTWVEADTAPITLPRHIRAAREKTHPGEYE